MVNLRAPAGAYGIIQGVSGLSYTVGSDGTITGVAQGDVLPLIRAGFYLVNTEIRRVSVNAPVAADLTTTVNAVTPTNVALTLAAQPPHPRKLQMRIVIGTTTTTAITAGIATIVGIDQDGNAITETLSMVATTSTTFKTANAYAKVTSITVSAYAANGSGTGNTIGFGPSNDFGMPTDVFPADFAIIKATKVTAVLGTSVVAADDVAATATVDAVARTIAPTTAPSATGLINYEFTYSYMGSEGQ